MDSARWEGFRLRPGDIVISTPPKCGTTWTQRICALLVFQTAQLHRPLGEISPWLDMLTRPLDEVLADLEAQTHRRFIKTHTPLDGLPFEEHAHYICVGRDPRDVALSWSNHVANLDPAAFFAARERTVGSNDDIAEMMAKVAEEEPASEQEKFWSWVEGEDAPTENPSTLVATLHHLRTFWKVRDLPNVTLLHYDDLKRDLEGSMRRLAARLGIEVPEDRWPELVRAATFESMRSEADRVAPGSSESIWQNNANFFHRGSSGQWRQVIGEGELERYSARLAALAAPEIRRWLELGSRG